MHLARNQYKKLYIAQKTSAVQLQKGRYFKKWFLMFSLIKYAGMIANFKSSNEMKKYTEDIALI